MSKQTNWPRALESLLVTREPADASHDIGHFRRVWRVAQEIADCEGGDLEVLVAAAYLHDLVAVPKNAPDRSMASRRSAEAAQPLLAQMGFPVAKLPAVAHAIEAHSYSAKIPPETLEAKIIQDADRIDAIGAIGIARCFHVAGQMGSDLFHRDDPLARTRQPNDSLYALDHFEMKLMRLAEGMCTPTGQRLALARQAVMRTFVDAFVADVS